MKSTSVFTANGRTTPWDEAPRGVVRSPQSNTPAARDTSGGQDDIIGQRLLGHARALAVVHEVQGSAALRGLLPRLERAAGEITGACRGLEVVPAQPAATCPSVAWLLENQSLLGLQIRGVRRQLRRWRGAFPLVAAGPGRGLLRAFHMAAELIDCAQGQLDEPRLHAFVQGYQQRAVLNLDELWVFPLMLRLALLEGTGAAATVVAEAVERRRPPAQHGPLSNRINSLRAMEDVDWKAFVEEQSAVEQVLRRDPGGAYAGMTFATRDAYRSAVQRLARRSGRREEDVARRAVEHARGFLRMASDERAAAAARHDRRCHVGYWLVDRGRAEFEKSIGYCPAPLEGVARVAQRFPLACYLGCAAVVWLLCTTIAGVAVVKTGAAAALGMPALLVLAVAGGVAAVQPALSLVNWLSTMIVPCRRTVRMDFSEGIPAEHRTLVAVPNLLTSPQAIDDMLEHLELRYLANQDENLLFALLTDLPDAPSQRLPTDAALLERARAGIQRLNRRHARGAAFFLLHRPRSWNACQGVWMGHERKRGKLAALNQLILTGSTAAFDVAAGPLAELTSVRYVITLDADTWLPRDAGRELAGCMAHPLCRPRVDPHTRMVVEGHGILQPRVSSTIPDARRSPYSRLMAVDPGMDPYTMQISDVYEDLFGQGSFIGKGIYDVAACEAALGNRFPDNRVLSHDLIEGCFARSGLVSEVELFEGVPARVLTDMSRQHRWVRGDWQIAAWLLGRVPAARGRVRNPLDGLSRWKIFDNLRRSLQPLCLLAFLVSGWCWAPGWAGLWSLLALAVTAGPTLVGLLPGFVLKPADMPWRLHLADRFQAAGRAVLREAASFALLPYRAFCNLDAAMRTLYRLHVSHRKLLEWTTSSETERRAVGGLRQHYEVMWAPTILSLSVAAALAAREPRALLWAGPLLAAWLASPLLAWLGSRSDWPRPVHMAPRPARQYRRWARRTWHFFERGVRAQEHWLPPDQIQYGAALTVRPMTSPTNIGLGLLAELTAADLGYLSTGRLIARLWRTLHSLGRLPRYRGHFFNWYHTRTLTAAEPRYVSTVDSGNLWGALLVLRAGLEELKDRPLVSPRLREGLEDTWDVLSASLPGPPANDDTAPPTASAARRFVEDARQQMIQLAASGGSPARGRRHWMRAALRQCTGEARDLQLLAFAAAGPLWETPAPAGEAAWLLARLREELTAVDRHCTLRGLPAAVDAIVRSVDRLLGQPGCAASPLAARLWQVRQSAQRAADVACRRLQRIDKLTAMCGQCAAMDFGFLFDSRKKLLAIGFNASTHRRDDSFYGHLASEARLASFLGVAHGQLPREHWFALGRMMTLAHRRPTLLSWSGSMFEYLMPMLFMSSHPGTLLEGSCRHAVRRQIRFGRQQGVPWGISESCYHHVEPNGHYRYRAFGVPGLALQWQPAESLVIAPYASALAAMVAPHAARLNLQRLEDAGCLGELGFCDAVDYTPGRRLPGNRPAPCRTVMAHHSGMALTAIAQILLDRPLERRFLAEPLHRAHDLLLQERRPQTVCPVDPRELQTRPAENADG